MPSSLIDSYPSQVIGELEHSRSLPKLLCMNDDRILVIGGQFVDNQEATFGEIITPQGHNDSDPHSILSTLESFVGTDFLNMYSLV